MLVMQMTDKIEETKKYIIVLVKYPDAVLGKLARKISLIVEMIKPENPKPISSEFTDCPDTIPESATKDD